MDERAMAPGCCSYANNRYHEVVKGFATGELP
jgi:hypothetical protein